MKKNMIMRFASVLLVATLISTCAISGTFAKYTSNQTASDKATVAKWAFNVGDTDIASNAFTFNLFNTVKDEDGGDEADISNTNGSIIAPGTSGSFDLVLTNTSEVTAEYAIEYTVDNAGVPILYRVDGGTWNTNIANVTAGTGTTLAPEATKTIKIEWKWAFGETPDDVTDTALGTAQTLAEPSVTAKITATQVN